MYNWWNVTLTSGTCTWMWALCKKSFWGSTCERNVLATVWAICALSFMTSPRWPVTCSWPPGVDSLPSSDEDGCWSGFVRLDSMYSVEPPATHNKQHLSLPLAAASDIHRQVPTNMADICRDWLTNQNTDCCFVVIGLSTRQSHSPLLRLKIEPVPKLVRHLSWRKAENIY